jgi:hypothetical protein
MDDFSLLIRDHKSRSQVEDKQLDDLVASLTISRPQLLQMAELRETLNSRSHLQRPLGVVKAGVKVHKWFGKKDGLKASFQICQTLFARDSSLYGWMSPLTA